MRVSLEWLSEYVDSGLAPSELAERLTMAGLQVEVIERLGADATGVVAGQVETLERHPNADKLSVCRVSTGAAVHAVVCGAPNVKAGGVYPFAPIGAVLPGNFKIKKVKLRGVESEGMLCSAKELELAGDADGLMQLPPGTLPGTPLAEILGPPDTVLELAITPNRPDCLGLLGIAREVAAITGRAVRPPPLGPLEEDGSIADWLAVDLQAADGCPRYSARVVRNIQVGPSPPWMRRRLTAAGLRPINNVVDITNYVMLERAHPMHAFDARFIQGRRIVVRWAADAEPMTTLDGSSLSLEPGDLLIADAQRGIALAGIMGGQNSEIRDDTTEVVLEAAYFDPIAIRKSSRRLRIHTDSSHRFERGCDPNATLDVLDRAALLLARHAGGTVAGGRIDRYPEAALPRPVRLRPARVNRLLGTALSPERMAALLARLELPSSPESAGELTVRIPTFRPDLEGEADLAEEIARIEGYGAIEDRPPRVPSMPIHESPVLTALRETRAVLTGAGLDDAIHLTFAAQPASAAVVALANPLAEEAATLRGDLVTGLVGALQTNLQRQARPPRLFETGRVFSAERATGAEGPFAFPDLPRQPYHAAALLAGPAGSDWRHGARSTDFHTAAGLIALLAARLRRELTVQPRLPDTLALPAVAHPGRRAGVYLGERCVGFVAELAPDLPFLKRFPLSAALLEIDLEQVAAVPPRNPLPGPLPAFPRADRDLAFLLPEEVRHAAVEAAIRGAAGERLESVTLFDVFTGKSLPAGKKSVAFNLAFRHPQRTLTDAEVDAAVESVVAAVRALGGELR